MFSLVVSRSRLALLTRLPVYFKAFSAKGIFVTPNGQAKIDAVEKFIKFIFQPEMIARFVEQAGMNPSIKDVKVDESKLNPLFRPNAYMHGGSGHYFRHLYARCCHDETLPHYPGSIYVPARPRKRSLQT